MAKQKVNVKIAGRIYPITVSSEKEEESLRKAEKNISNLIRKFEGNYAISDKQDVIAMCALQFATKLESDISKTGEDSEKSLKKINELIELLDNQL